MLNPDKCYWYVQKEAPIKFREKLMVKLERSCYYVQKNDDVLCIEKNYYYVQRKDDVTCLEKECFYV